MIPKSVVRVTNYLEGLAAMPHLDQREIQGISVNREDEPRLLLTEDLVDLIRRAMLCDSLAAEIDRQDQIITRLREEAP